MGLTTNPASCAVEQSHPSPLGVLRIAGASTAAPEFSAPCWMARTLSLGLSTARHFLSVPRREPPRVVHCLSGTAAVSWTEGLEASVTHIPLVATVTGDDLARLSHANSLAHRLRRALGQAGMLIAESEEVHGELHRWGFPEDRVATIRRGVPVSSIPPSGPRPHEAWAESPRLRVLCSGPLVERQGLDFLLEAVARLSRGHGGPHLTVLGAGPLLRQARALAEHLGIVQSVEFLPRVKTPSEFLAQCSSADVFVASCVTARNGDREAGPSAGLLLAMAAALPAVATRHAGIAELIQDGRTGFLAPERDVDGLVSALARARGAPGRGIDVGLAGRAAVERDHDLRRTEEELERVYALVTVAKPSCDTSLADPKEA